MTAATAPTPGFAPPPRSTNPHQTTGWWAMVCVCATEASFFAYLITAYFYLDLRSPAWPPPGIEPPKLIIPAFMTATLLLGSGTMIWAEHGAREGKRRQMLGGLIATMVLALIFLALFAHEYADKLQHMVPSTHAYASLFYLITGVHGLHVTFGLLLVGFTLVAAWRGHITRDRRLLLANASLYWHFIDVVWLSIIATIYLSPHFA